MTDEPQTGRARRLQAVEQGERSTGIEAIEQPAPPRPGTPRHRQLDIRDRRAADLDVEADRLGTRDTIGGGVRLSARGESRPDIKDAISRRFAADTAFTEPDDVTAGISGQSIEATPFVSSERRPEVAERARPAAADELDADSENVRIGVGPQGVEAVQVNPQREFEAAFGDPESVDQGLGGGDTFEFEAVFGSDDDSDSFRL